MIDERKSKIYLARRAARIERVYKHLREAVNQASYVQDAEEAEMVVRLFNNVGRSVALALENEFGLKGVRKL